MVKVSVLYPHKNDAKFNMDYYLTTNDVRVHRHLEGVEPPRRTRVFNPSDKDNHWDAASWREINDENRQVSRGYEAAQIMLMRSANCSAQGLGHEDRVLRQART
jgi:hypothetical protein